MLDTIYSKIATTRKAPFNPEYDPQKVVIGERFSEAESTSLAVIIPPWHHSIAQRRLAQRLGERGVSTMSFAFDAQLLRADIKSVDESIQAAAKHVANRIEVVRDAGSYTDIHLITMSLGSITQALVAEQIGDFTTATFAATGDDLVRGVWDGIRTTPIREAFEEQGVTREDLEAGWGHLAPKQHFEAFAGHDVYFKASSTDEIVPHDTQLSYIRGLASAGAHVTASFMEWGHLAVPAYLCFEDPLEHIV